MSNDLTLSNRLPSSPPVYRVLYGALYRRETQPSAFDMRVHDLGHGHVEATLQPVYSWHEVAGLSPSALTDHAMAQGNIFVDGAWLPAPALSERERLDKLALNRDRSARRARTKVRRLCKARGLAVMLTLTYRENMLDRDRMARDFDVFVKRLRRIVPSFEYVCVFERQKRGSWHAHIAVPKVLSHYLHKGALVRSYDLLRSVWRAVVGADNGNVDVSRNRRIMRSSAKLAAYIAKYIGKGFGEAVEGGDSYRASGRDLPPPSVIRHHSADPTESYMALLGLLSPEIANSKEFHRAYLDSGGAFVSISR